MADGTADPSAVVDIAAVTQGDDNHQQHVIMDGVDDRVIAHAHPEAVTALECLCPGRARILAKQRDRAADAIAVLVIDALERSNGGGSKFDPIAHSQPRSFLT